MKLKGKDNTFKINKDILILTYFYFTKLIKYFFISKPCIINMEVVLCIYIWERY